MIDLSLTRVDDEGTGYGSVERADLETDLLDVIFNLDEYDSEDPFVIVNAVIEHLDSHYALARK